MNFNIFEKKPNLDEIDFKNKVIYSFKVLDIEQLNNCIFVGKKGCGKTTQIYALLCSILDKRVYNLKNNEVELEKRIFKFKSSIYHLEIDCLELLNNERIFFNNYLKEYIDARNIGLDIPKIIYFINLEKLSKISLLYLRKLIEKNYHACKFIIETSNLSLIPVSLTSRFLTLRIPVPKRKDIEIILKNIIKQKKIKITKVNLNKIIDNDLKYKNYHDLNNIFISLEYYKEKKELINNNFYNTIDEIINIIYDKKIDFNNMINIKNICEKIFINCYDINELLNCIYFILIDKNKNDIDLVYKIIDESLKSNINIFNSTGKFFIHLENYIIKLIILINNIK